MTTAIPVSLPLTHSLTLSAYQLLDGGQELLLFTHRQIAEAIGRTKSTVQRYFKQHGEDFPPLVTAKIPHRPHPVSLTPLSAALAYWQSQSEAGNETAASLLAALSERPLTVVGENSEPDVRASPATLAQASLPTDLSPAEEVAAAVQAIETAARWMEEAGVEPVAIAAWKLSQLRIQMPDLAPVLSSAQSFLAKEATSPQGMIPSQLAEELASQLGRKVTAAQVNQALHDLGFQEYARPGKSRERKLTAAGKHYGVAVLATSSDGWQGCQIRWRESVVEVLVEYLSRNNKTAKNIS